MFEYNIEVDTMNGIETYKFQSQSQSIEKYLQDEMIRGNLKTALSLQNDDIKLVGYWNFDDEYIEIKSVKYQCHESDYEGIYTESELRQMWDNEIDKSNFESFECWLEEMLEIMILRIME